MAEISAQAVNEFRKKTGLGLMECKALLKEADGDIARADTLAKERGLKKAELRSGRAAKAGRVEVYIHHDAKSGVMVELNCETDFVARNDNFVEFALDLALHIAAAQPLAVTDEDIPAEDREREERIAIEQAADRPENVRERIVAGKLDKWLDEVVLLRQKHVNEDKHGGKTIEELRAAMSVETGENVVIRRFARFSVGG